MMFRAMLEASDSVGGGGSSADAACLAGWEDCTSNDQCCSGFCTGSGMCSDEETKDTPKKKTVVEEVIKEDADYLAGWEDCKSNDQCCSGFCTGSGMCSDEETKDTPKKKKVVEKVIKEDAACLAGWEDCKSNDQCCSGFCTGSGMCSDDVKNASKELKKEVVKDVLEKSVVEETIPGTPRGEEKTCVAGWGDCSSNDQCCSGFCTGSGMCSEDKDKPKKNGNKKVIDEVVEKPGIEETIPEPERVPEPSKEKQETCKKNWASCTEHSECCYKLCFHGLCP